MRRRGMPLLRLPRHYRAGIRNPVGPGYHKVGLSALWRDVHAEKKHRSGTSTKHQRHLSASCCRRSPPWHGRLPARPVSGRSRRVWVGQYENYQYPQTFEEPQVQGLRDIFQKYGDRVMAKKPTRPQQDWVKAKKLKGVCWNCIHWNISAPSTLTVRCLEELFRQCRRYPPQVSGTGMSRLWLYPAVCPTDKCGEYRECESVKDREKVVYDLLPKPE